MAAYAALVSVMHIIDQIQLHPRPPISLDKKQVESLTEKVTFLQEFLENYSLHVGYSKEADDLESRIADAAYEAEDIIESHIVDQILAGSTSHGGKTSSIDLYQGLKKVIQDLDLIKKEVMETKEKTGVQHQLHRNSSVSAGSLRPSTGQSITMVGFDDRLVEIMDKLTGQQSNLQIMPIVGMGGIGKTTLARSIYTNPITKDHFDICVWATVSQRYKMREILLELLQQGRESLSQENEYELGDKLHKRLSGRRYLIIMDDIWDTEVWDQLKFFFPDNNRGSRIMLTTRLSNLAFQVAGSRGIDMAFLDEFNSWNLFSKIVFGEEGCPLELQEIGKKIVQNCRGLPLSIVVIGGLLAKSKHTLEYWEYIEGNLNSIVNSEDDGRCLKILHMSYNQLPIYLKPCFLYMGVFMDSAIRVSVLVKLWVAKGFLKPISGKSLEAIAQEYVKELIDRNLILVHKLGRTGRVKYCNIHDLVRDLCLREAQKERFYNVTKQHSLNTPQGMSSQRRIVIPKSTSEEKVRDALQSTSLARSLICNVDGVLPLVNLRLLRTLRTCDKDSSYHQHGYVLESMFQLVNSRYLAVQIPKSLEFPSSVYLLWNLQTLILHNSWVGLTAPVEIWNMPRLRHVEFSVGFYLPDPPSSSKGNYIVLGNLQTLQTIYHFKCGEEVVKRIPNIKKLNICYQQVEGSSSYFLNNLRRLQKLESFRCSSPLEFDRRRSTHFLQNLTFPHSLKKLTLSANLFRHLEDMLEEIGSLPFLEKLILKDGPFRKGKWETVEGQFRNLKFLRIEDRHLRFWTTESSHLPSLEHLVLRDLHNLIEIPSDIGEIPTLLSIDLQYCSYSAIISAKKIHEEQEQLGNEGLRVRVTVFLGNDALESLGSPNFRVECLFKERRSVEV